MSSVFISIGSNVGNTVRTCNESLKQLSCCPQIQIVKRSGWYRTEPFGPVNQTWFTNMAIEVSTSLEPLALLDYCQSIETKLGRQRTIHWGPRTIDLDLLLWDHSIIVSSRLLIPHPWLHKRRFVLVPLADIAPGIQHPVFEKSIQELIVHSSDTLKIAKLEHMKELIVR